MLVLFDRRPLSPYKETVINEPIRSAARGAVAVTVLRSAACSVSPGAIRS